MSRGNDGGNMYEEWLAGQELPANQIELGKADRVALNRRLRKCTQA